MAVGDKGTALATTPTSSGSSSVTDVDAAVVLDAVYVRNAQKSYGVGKRKSHVLKGLDMTVKKGTIYGLLGASGCGKTTLLSCIVGRRSLDSGDVAVFGGEPGTKQSGIPGPCVGYMPQELALYGEFTIQETLQYFGRIYNLPSEFVKSQMDFLFKLLDLPPRNRYVKTLSGGQQRRVSFAVALFHEPELLILDEPTVGVDPLLRQSIWNHLVRLSRDSGRTVIITTHYIEEARQAHTVGLMRSGRLLAEESPQNLLSRHRLPTLEEVFLKLCMKDGSAQTLTTVAATSPENKMGVENPAFVTASNGDLRQATLRRSVVRKRTNNNDGHVEDEAQGNEEVKEEEISSNLSQLSIVPSLQQYWKKTESVFTTEEDGIVGLTFSPSGDNLLQYSQKDTVHQLGSPENLMNERNAQMNERIPHSNGVEKGKASPYQLDNSDESLYHHSSTQTLDQQSVNSSSARKTKRRSRSWRLTMPSAHRTSALIRKNFMQTFRNIGMFLFIFLLPAAQSILFCLAIGRDPTYLKVAVVNEELNVTEGKICNASLVSPDFCSFSMYSCRYLAKLNNETISQVHYDDFDTAIEASKSGDVWGVVHFGKSFTDDLMVRQSQGNEADNETISGSSIGITLDWSNQQIAITLQRRFIDAFDAFSKDILRTCDYNPEAGSIPVTFLDPIYGDKDPSFTEFMAPGIILTIVYFIAVALTAAVFINERKQGLLDRSLVAGVTTTEILVAHLVNQFTVLVGQTALVLVSILVIFSVPCRGSVILVIVITLLQGLCGMSFGMLVSTLCDEETSAIHLSLGSFYPNLLLSGVMWPLEGMPYYLRYFSYILPQTYAVQSIRFILARGWGLDRVEVYGGILMSLFWMVLLLGMSGLVVRIRKYTG